MTQEDNRIRLIVVIPTQHSVHIDTEFVIKHYVMPDPRFLTGLVYPRDSFAKGAAQMRNLGIKHVLDIEPVPDWAMFMDSDTVPKGNPLDAIADNPDADVVVLMTPIWAPNSDPVNPVLSNVWVPGEDGEPEPRWIDHDVEGPYVTILKAGAGCMFVRERVLRDRDVRFIPSLDDDLLWDKSEDLAFCDRAREKGYKVVLYTPIICGHYQLVDIAKIHDAVSYWREQAIGALKRVRELEEEKYATMSPVAQV